MTFLEDIYSAFCSCLPLKNEPVLKINGVRFKIIKLLGEGGFSYVYLVERSDGGRYALKKIRCSFGAESIKNAMNEVSAYKEFNSPYIVKLIDSSIVQEKDGLQSIYILLPYFKHGTLQDVITRNMLNGQKIPEADAIRLFIGICRGLQIMHRHKLTYHDRVVNADNIDLEIERLTRPEHKTTNTLPGIEILGDNAEAEILLADSDEENEGETQTVGSNNYASLRSSDAADALNDGVSINTANISETTELGDSIPYAHKDIKPANVMLSMDEIPVLCDLGSCSKARTHVKTRKQALELQEHASEHCTLPYRAPELLDVNTGAYIDERVDIWSLGCLLYALLYGSSPFERAEAESGASVSLAISSGKYEFPSNDEYSNKVKDLIKFCLVVNPDERPTIEQVLSKALSNR